MIKYSVIFVVSLVAGLVATNWNIGLAATQSITLNAYVPAFCAVAGRPASLSYTITIPVDAAGNINTDVQTFTSHSAVCNANASLKVKSRLGGAIADSTAGSAGSLGVPGAKIDYVVIARFGGAVSTINTAKRGGDGSVASTGGPVKGEVIVTVTPIQPQIQLEPFSVYSDTVTIRLQTK
jgi:hypothetical protein